MRPPPKKGSAPHGRLPKTLTTTTTNQGGHPDFTSLAEAKVRIEAAATLLAAGLLEHECELAEGALVHLDKGLVFLTVAGVA